MECFNELLDELGGNERFDRNDRIAKNLRKQQRFSRIAEKRRLTRPDERRRRRQNQAGNSCINEALSTVLQIYVDFGYTQQMSDKEMAKLVRQMGRVWGLQKRNPGLQVTLLSPDDRFLCEGQRKMSGFDHFNWIISDKSINEIVTEHHIVYLSPDSRLNPLLNVKPDEVYVIGGLVDETGAGSLSFRRAEELGLDARRLPIKEFLQRRDAGTFSVMLTVNQVVEILVRYVRARNWIEALSVVPKRTGYEAIPSTT